MAAQRLIVNELLAFIQNALNISDLDHYSIVETCKVNFKPEEINKAKVLLFHLIDNEEQIVSLQECSQDLSAIIDLFEKTDVANVPVFVAKQLNRLPLVLFERPSIQNLVMEIHFLKASLVETQSKLVAANNNVSELCKHVYTMYKAQQKRFCLHGSSSKDTDEVKSASNDTKSGEAPRPAPRISMPTSWACSNVTAVQRG